MRTVTVSPPMVSDAFLMLDEARALRPGPVFLSCRVTFLPDLILYVARARTVPFLTTVPLTFWVDDATSVATPLQEPPPAPHLTVAATYDCVTVTSGVTGVTTGESSTWIETLSLLSDDEDSGVVVVTVAVLTMLPPWSAPRSVRFARQSR
jgi:hypothetical protein